MTKRMVMLADETVVPFDVLVVASLATSTTSETEGLDQMGLDGKTFTFYDLPGATALAKALDRFDGGRI